MDAEIRRPKRGQQHDLRIEELDARGRGVAHVGPHRVVTPDTIPGERVQVEVTRRARGEVFARVLERLEPSPFGVAPRCPHARSCGGCAFQALAYDRQLDALRDQVAAAFAAEGLSDIAFERPVPCDPPWHYRNKIELSFGAMRWVEADEPEGVDRDFALGFHASGRFDRVLDLQSCHIAFEAATPILRTLRTTAREAGLPAWNARAHEGLLRHAVLRHGFATGETLLHLITSPGHDERVASWLQRVAGEHPELDTIVHGRKAGVADVALPDESTVLTGEGHLHEELLGVRFRLGPLSFFQTNTRAAERLFARLSDLIRARAPRRLVDLYCGAGTIGLVLADAVEEVVGYELVPEAVLDAEANAARNGITNARFLAGDVLKTAIPAEREFDGDLVVLDPPRAGLHPKVLQALLAAGPPQIAFVSCNPRVAAAQVAAFVRAGWTLEVAELFDLFPHTPHVEGLFMLSR